MPTTEIRSGSVILKDSVAPNGRVFIDGSKIVRVSQARDKDSKISIDASGCYVSPGFIDTHIHGSPGRIFENEIPRGTTSFIVAVPCAPLSAIYKRIVQIKNRANSNCILGVRIEGPYIAEARAGAQDKKYIKQPDVKELRSIIRRAIKGVRPLLRIMTVAPELVGAKAVIKELCENGIIASVGHSNATCAETAEGIASGIRHATHIFNAMSGKEDPASGVAGAVLGDRRVWAEAIFDLVHVDRKNLRLLLKKKGPNKTILISDSVGAQRSKGVRDVGQAYRFEDGRLAGSSISLIDAVKNCVKTFGISLPDAVGMASLNPARLIGIDDRKGSIAAGKDADIVIFDKNFNVKMTIINGRIAYRRAGF